MKHTPIVLSCCVALFLMVPGCGSSSQLEGLTSVSGKVTYNGAPVENATVMFAPTGAGVRAATGVTDAQGVYRLQTLNPNDGAMPGEYYVTVSKSEPEGPVLSSEEIQAHVARHGRPPTQTMKDMLPEKYKRPATSGFTATVSAGGKNVFDLPLTD